MHRLLPNSITLVQGWRHCFINEYSSSQAPVCLSVCLSHLSLMREVLSEPHIGQPALCFDMRPHLDQGRKKT